MFDIKQFDAEQFDNESFRHKLFDVKQTECVRERSAVWDLIMGKLRSVSW